MSQTPAGEREVRYVHAYGRLIAIERDRDDVALPFLPFEWRQGRPDDVVDRRYTVEKLSPRRWGLAIDDGEPVRYADPAQVANQIEGDLHHWLATYTRGYLFVHAGCVGWRQRAIVIPGRSFAGKTTLTRALLEAGAVYYSDDYAVIDPEGRIHPFPRRLQVRPEEPGPTIRLDPAGAEWPVGRDPIRAALVAEVKYDRDAGWQVEPLTAGAGALSLLDNTVAARERPEDALRVMTRVMANARAVRGTRDESTVTAGRLLELVDEIVGYKSEVTDPSVSGESTPPE